MNLYTHAVVWHAIVAMLGVGDIPSSTSRIREGLEVPRGDSGATATTGVERAASSMCGTIEVVTALMQAGPF